MKTILVPVDFSKTAKYAGHYASYLANTMHTNLLLCHALEVPVSTSETAVLEQLELQAEDLKQNILAKELIIDCIAVPGLLTEVVEELVKRKDIGLVVMGMLPIGALTRMLLGGKSKDMIDRARFPVLLVPLKEVHGKINKIAFASDLSNGDIGLIHALAGFARQFNAEILVVHISKEKVNQHKIDRFLTEVTCKVNYPKIYYRHIEDQDINRGLNWIAKNGLIDVFAMVHRRKSFSENLFGGSHTHHLSRSIEIPLLVFPEEVCPVF